MRRLATLLIVLGLLGCSPKASKQYTSSFPKVVNVVLIASTKEKAQSLLNRIQKYFTPAGILLQGVDPDKRGDVEVFILAHSDSLIVDELTQLPFGFKYMGNATLDAVPGKHIGIAKCPVYIESEYLAAKICAHELAHALGARHTWRGLMIAAPELMFFATGFSERSIQQMHEVLQDRK